MTSQVSDTFLFKGEEYSLIGMTEGELTSPEQFGMEPAMLSTGCYRGFYATYELTEDAIFLRELTLREKNGNYLPIEGILPEMFIRVYPRRHQLLYLIFPMILLMRNGRAIFKKFSTMQRGQMSEKLIGIMFGKTEASYQIFMAQGDTMSPIKM